MTFRIEVSTRSGEQNPRLDEFTGGLLMQGQSNFSDVVVSEVFFVDGAVDAAGVAQLVEELLCDPVTQEARWWRLGEGPARDGSWRTVEVALRPGVTDSAAESLVWGARQAGIVGVERAACARRYAIRGLHRAVDLGRVARALVVNEVVQRFVVDEEITPSFVEDVEGDGYVERFPLEGLDEEALVALSRARRLALDGAEMQAIQAWYAAQGRAPTDVELEMIAQTWSEHCIHKTFRAEITFERRGADGARVGEVEVVDSLLETYLRAATEEADRPWVRSAFVDNAGIVALDADWDLAFKVETHNRPSALEPFGGANTGVGGVVRDIIGVSARPIANTDVLCFGPLELEPWMVPAGVLHPERIYAGVVAGIEDYGNKMGIPTVNGAVVFDEGYVANPLVYCGCLGVLPRGGHPRQVQAGQRVVAVGGRTGRDGLRGATFSSMEMSAETGAIAGSAVQIGHPIHEKQALEAIMQARDEGLYTAITDCGAGGFSSAVGELAGALGAEIELERAPLKYPGLRPWEIWLSEAQERMILAVHDDAWPRLQALCARLDVEATTLGRFRDDGRLLLRYQGEIVGDLDARFLRDGLPRRRLRAVWTEPVVEAPSWAPSADLTGELLAMLDSDEGASRAPLVRRYDHEVQGGTVVKPLVGVACDGPSDAAVLAPLALQGTRGVALSVGINPWYGRLDPCAMAMAAVDEAMRNAVAVGADPDRIALLDNFCWGNPNLPDRLGGLVRCAQGCYAAARLYNAPFISGKDSLNNEYTDTTGARRAIPGTILISALGVVPDVARTVTSDLKAIGGVLYALGAVWSELGGSLALRRQDEPTAGVPPKLRPGALERMRALHAQIATGRVRACHDCAEGGLAIALAEMCIGGRLGAHIDLNAAPRGEPDLSDAEALFSESLTRFVIEVAPGDADAFEAALSDAALARIGVVSDDGWLRVTGTGGAPVVNVEVEALVGAFVR